MRIDICAWSFTRFQGVAARESAYATNAYLLDLKPCRRSRNLVLARFPDYRADCVFAGVTPKVITALIPVACMLANLEER
jgi:hypothetical protein